MWGHSPWSLHYFCSCFTRKGSWTRNSLPRATAPSSIRRALRNDFRAQRTNSVRRKCTHQLLDGRRFGWNQFPTLKGSSWSPKTSKMFEFVLELLIFLLAVRIWHPSPFEGPPPPPALGWHTQIFQWFGVFPMKSRRKLAVWTPFSNSQFLIHPVCQFSTCMVWNVYIGPFRTVLTSDLETLFCCQKKGPQVTC